MGSTLAVTIELPIILATSWLMCRWITGSLSVSQEIDLRLVMGSSAFALTIAAELILGRYGFGRTFSQMLAGFGTAVGALGLLGQIAFAAFPLLQRRVW